MQYELTYLTDKESNEIKDSLLGKVLNVQKLKNIGLCYPIKDKKSAFMGVISLDCPEEKTAELKEKLEKNEDIMRFLLIKKEFKRDIIKNSYEFK